MTASPGPTSSATSTGLAPNVAGALAYLLGALTGIAFLVLEKENRFVRFHAAQSIAVSVLLVAASIALTILSTVLAIVPVLGWVVAVLLSALLAFATFFLWLFLMWRAFQGEEWEAPIAGHLARKLAP